MKKCFVRTQHEKGNYWSVNMDLAKGDIPEALNDEGAVLKMITSKKRRNSAPVSHGAVTARGSKAQRRTAVPRANKVKNVKGMRQGSKEPFRIPATRPFVGAARMMNGGVNDGVPDPPGKRSVEVQTDITLTMEMYSSKRMMPQQYYMGHAGHQGPSQGMMNMFGGKQQNQMQQQQQQQQYQHQQMPEFYNQQEPDGVSPIGFRAPRIQQNLPTWTNAVDTKPAQTNFALQGFTYPGTFFLMP